MSIYLNLFCQQLNCFGVVWGGCGFCINSYLKVLKLYIMTHDKYKYSTMNNLNGNKYPFLCDGCKYMQIYSMRLILKSFQ